MYETSEVRKKLPRAGELHGQPVGLALEGLTGARNEFAAVIAGVMVVLRLGVRVGGTVTRVHPVRAGGIPKHHGR